MSKKTASVIAVSAATVILVCVAAVEYWPKKNIPVPNPTAAENGKNPEGRECILKFTTERNAKVDSEPEVLKLDFFQSFNSGAFFGKIADFQPGDNKRFADLVSHLMQEQKIKTFEHLRADVCLEREDLINPENGASLDYYIEHYYCTNHCQTGHYEIRVDLDAGGNFVGYRTSRDIF